MKKFLTLIALIVLTACGKDSGEALDAIPTDLADVARCSDTTHPSDDARPNLLVIGDSISWSYSPKAKELLPELEFSHNDCNARSSRNHYYNIDQWLAHRDQWEMVTFNAGMWDIAFNVSQGDYRNYLRIVGTKIKAKAKHVIFFTTTYVPENNVERTQGDEDIYNVIARQEMAALGIPVYELGAFSQTITHLMVDPIGKTDVHFTPEGADLLGEFVAQAIKTELAK